ncbi:MAG: sigma 54-interacting transcriptional regulator [Planctomycetota bacterium]|nr:sigma 54-interacting transcriptional regulator [Planctomycetota bacterium]
MSPAEVPSVLRSAPRLGRFRPRRFVGRGSFGAVWEVDDPLRPKRRLALKVLVAAGARSRERLRETAAREFHLGSRLRHPVILETLEAGTLQVKSAAEQLPYLLSDFFPGEPLRPPWGAEALRTVAGDLLSALDTVHAAGWRHGDLKPGNVLVDRSEERPDVRILDFGLAVEAAGPGGAPVRGTLRYVSPEALRGARVDQRADLYALGVLLFECLAGRSSTPLAQHLVETRDGRFAERLETRELAEPWGRLLRRLLDPDPRSRLRSGAEGLEILATVRADDEDGADESYTAVIPDFEAARPVGREDFFEALDHALGRQLGRRPAPALVIVEGGRGLGKTRLVHEAESRAFTREVRPLSWLRARELAHDDAGRAASPGVDDPSGQRLLALGSLGDAPLAGAERAAESILERLVERPTLLTVDDLEELAADDRQVVLLLAEKLRALPGASRRRRRHPPFVLATCGEGVLESAEFAPWWNSLADMPWVTAIRLRPWSEREVATYLDRALSPRHELGPMGVLLRRETGGHPGRLRATLRELARGGELRLEKGAWVSRRSPSRGLPPLPDERRGFAAEWESLPSSLRELLGVAATWSDPLRSVPANVLASALGLPERRLHRRLRRLLALERLGPGLSLEPEGLRLPVKARLWVLRAAGPEVRRGWRRRLARSSAPEAERLYQELRSGRAPPPGQLLMATKEARDPGQGTERLLAAASRCSAVPRRGRGAAALGLGEILHGRGDFRGAGRYLNRARADVDSGERQRIDVLLAEGFVLRGRLGEAREALDRVRDGAGPGVPFREPVGVDRPRFLFASALCEFLAGDFAAARRVAGRALEENPEDFALKNLLANAAMRLGDTEEAARIFRAALENAAVSGDPRILGALRSNYGRLLTRQGKLREALAAQRRATADFEGAGLKSQAARIAGNLGSALRSVGEYGAAVEAATRSLELQRSVGDRHGMAVAEINLGVLARELGLPGTAWRRLRVAESLARESPWGDGLLEHPAYLETRTLLAIDFVEEEVLEDLLERRRKRSSREVVPEALLVELRLCRSGRQSDRELQELLRERPYTEADAAFLLEFLSSPAAEERAAGSAADELLSAARFALARLGEESARAAFCRTLVELESGDAAPSRQVLEDLRAGLERYPARDGRRRALCGLARWSPTEEERRAARAELRRLLDEVLSDLAPEHRDEYRRRQEIEEAWKVAREREAANPSLEKAREVVRQVFRFNREILQETDVDGLCRKIVDAAVALTGAERGILVLRRRGPMRVVAARSAGKDLDDPESQMSRTLLERTLEGGAARLTTDAREDVSLRSIASVDELGLRSVMCVPLRVGRQRLIGALYLDNNFQRAAFDSDDLELAESFCAQAGLAWGAAERREQVAGLLKQARAANRQLRGELDLSQRAAARRSLGRLKGLEGIVGDSPPMRDLFHLMEVVAPTDIPVLIAGESGTGKELVARALHRLSSRASRPFVAENCAAVPASLLESALFGYVKGAFTGADRDAAGIFQMADGGTLFLDEIAELPPQLQTRLLRVLQDGEVRPLGARKTVQVDVRILAATNRDVQQAIDEGRFREDLYYRLQGAELLVPPLRERAEDVPLLVQHFLTGEGGQAVGKKVSPEAIDCMTRHSWPGNVRELENEVRRLALLCPDEVIGVEYLSRPIRDGGTVATGGDAGGGDVHPLREVERRAILNAMHHFDGHRGKVAKALGISRSTLYVKLKESGWLDGERGRPERN